MAINYGSNQPSNNRIRARRALAILMAYASLLAGCGDNTDTAQVTPAELTGKSFVLVHGAWSGAWAWAEVKAGLEAKGAAVATVELPSHGDDQTAVADASLQGDVDAVRAAIELSATPAVVVGHSFGGVVISQAAEDSAENIDKLVYLAAFVPKNDESLLDIAMTDADSQLGPALVVDQTHGVAGVDRSKFGDIFCADCPAAVLALLESKYRDEPLVPLATKVRISASKWGAIPKFYISTSEDHVISPSLQSRMVSAVHWDGQISLVSSHSPFLSTPARVVSALSGIAKERK